MMNSKLTSTRYYYIALALPALLLLAACEATTTRFERIAPERSGISFRNELKETPELNIFNYLYYYNGGGVGVGDFNKDGLPDLYFSANQHENKLYLNEGDFRFRDITRAAGVQGPQNWNTGVSIVDVNADGWLDIYVSTVGSYLRIQGHNYLYVNKGNNENGEPVFEEEAKKYGLDLIGFSTQAAFFDYDLDGDLDMYMLNHSVHSNGTFVRADQRNETHPLAGDKLLRNDGHFFHDVTEKSGIHSSAIGYGLGITVSDINSDGYPDLYIGNDFHENDYLYINNGNGTFSEKLEDCIQHTSRYSMGNDIADINNDGLQDILSLDMLPKDYEKLKASAGEDAYDVYNYKLGFGYAHQFARNTLQLNMGHGKFSEVGMLAGIYATDWSWSGLFADFDLNGKTDIFIANGIKGRTNDLDYIKFISNEAIQYRLNGDMTEAELALTKKMPVVKIPNYMYANEGGFRFKDVSQEWGLGINSFSNGAAYADLDVDGDLDLVINNINEEAFVFKNNTLENKTGHNYLQVRLEGGGKNPFGIGAKVVIPKGDEVITRELYPVRGFLSSMDYLLSIGLSSLNTIDSLTVIWPDRSYQVIRNVKANQLITVKKSAAKGVFSQPHKQEEPLLRDVTREVGVEFVHEENDFIEFNREQLIPHMLSAEGPCLAIGDINGDGKDDFFVGGAKRKPARIFIQTESRTSFGFTRSFQESISRDSIYEDVSSLLLDVDGDRDLDLVVASGGNEFRGKSEYNQPRVYLNDGRGRFSRSVKSIQDVHLNASVVTAADYDLDGDLDLFIGARSVPWNYGANPESYLLQNDGNGVFTPNPGHIPQELIHAGMVTDAVWADMNHDDQPDLVVAGEWEPVRVFINEGGKLSLHKSSDQLATSSGWWNTIKVTDVNGDGHPDIIAGNLGTNSKLKADEAHPLTLFVNDFDGNGQSDPILCYYDQDKLRLFHTRDEIAKQLVAVKKRFTDYRGFAEAGFYDVLPEAKIEAARKLYAGELRSCLFLNDGNMNFARHALPVRCQFAPVHAIAFVDLNNDGEEDLVAGGNFFRVNIQRGRYDAGYGIIMLKEGDTYKYVPNDESGFYLEGEIREICPITIGGKKHLIFARNDNSLKIYSITNDTLKYSR